MAPGGCPAVETGTYPTPVTDRHQWLTWKPTDDGRKIPRAPYLHSDAPDRFVDAQDPAVWTDFETASEWAAKLPGHELAFTIRNRDEYPDEDLVLIDYDDARDPETGAIHPTVREQLEQAASYADVSPSGTGVHLLCKGMVPEGVKTITDTLPADTAFPDAEIEVYDSARYVAMSGDHIQDTPQAVTDCQALLEDLVDEYATVVEGTPDELVGEPTASKEEVAAIDTTDDIQAVFDAIQHTRPSDIRLQSPVTEERSDGSKSLDPSWTTSESGTRLAQVDDRWIYRDGMIGLDALQVVALEEGLITDERTYPSGETFWEAVDALRDRGAHIPEYESARDADEIAGGGARSPAATIPDTAGETTSNSALEHEAELLRETVTEQQARIDELEAQLEDREATIEVQQARIDELETILAESDVTSRDQQEDPGVATADDDDREQDAPSLLTVVKQWLNDR